jgi:pyruvate, water dikinase
MLVVPFTDITRSDVAAVGGKNASLGEMVRSLGAAGVRVPSGFATTAEAYRRFIAAAGLEPAIRARLAARQRGEATLQEAGAAIRAAIEQAPIPADLEAAIREAYRELSREHDEPATDVAVRSSATAEDLPEASFAGQQETYLNVRGEDAVVQAVRRCFASLFTDRAIAYREAHGFDHMAVALSAGVQKMVRADQGGAGVMFTLDTETGFPDVVLINAAWGLGENVVRGTVNPDEIEVFKPLLGKTGPAGEPLVPIIGKKLGSKQWTMIYAEDADDFPGHLPRRSRFWSAAEELSLERWADDGGPARLAPPAPVRQPGPAVETANMPTPASLQHEFVLTDEEAVRLAEWAVTIETHYGRPMDIEWAKDGTNGELYILQARPETVEARRVGGALKTFRLAPTAEPLLQGIAIGRAVASGDVRCVRGPEDLAHVRPGDVIVTPMTEPDWVPAMRTAAAIVTDYGGRTCHAAIVARELGIPAIVGTGDATTRLAQLDRQAEGVTVTVSCAGGADGFVYLGEIPFEVDVLDPASLPATDTAVMLNLATPEAAFAWWRLPADGVGLARMEFVVTDHLRVHPMALVHPQRVQDPAEQARIASLTRGYPDPTDYFVEGLARGLSRIAASRYPAPVIVRMSDFKTNEYARLAGGAAFEPHEENPMIGWRGASRYYDEGYREGFGLECRAIRHARDVIGLDNIVVMIPFCRTPVEADRVLEEMAANGLVRGERGLRVFVMAEIPSNIIEAGAFAERFDGFSIGSNDLTQLLLGIDRDSTRLAFLFDEEEPSVTWAIRHLIEVAHAHGRPVGICGEAPSNNPRFAAFLVEAGIDSISVNPDAFAEVKRSVAALERSRQRGRPAGAEPQRRSPMYPEPFG